MLHRALATLTLTVLALGSVWADCSSPAAKAGAAIFNTTTKTMQYCNGTNWVNTGVSDPAAAQTGCTGPVGKAGTVVYSTPTGVVQFCNGSAWVDTACASKRQPGGSGCTGPAGRPGAIIYATSANEMQFCDSTNWVAMGWPCGITATDPTVLKASDAAINNYFGAALNFTNNDAIIAAPYFNSNLGRAYVFTRTNNLWTQQAMLIPSDIAPGDYCGMATGSVKIDGDTAIVGCAHKNNGAGAVYVFTRTGSTWTQQAKLTASDSTSNKYFGSAIALSGNMAFIGAYGDGTSIGAVYVFTRSGSTWTQQTKITYPTTTNENFGYYVSFDNSSGTNTLLVSAYEYSSNFYYGAVYIFTGSGSSWSLQQKLNHPNPVMYGYFGRETSITSNTAVIGSYNSTNSAYVFTRNGSSWTQRIRLTASDGVPTTGYGSFVKIISNTNVTSTIMVGGGDSKKVYLYTGNGSSWTETKKLTSPDVANNSSSKIDMTSGTVAVGLSTMVTSTGQVNLLNF